MQSVAHKFTYNCSEEYFEARSQTTDSVWISADNRGRGITVEQLRGLATMQEFEDSVPSLLQLLKSEYIMCLFCFR